MSGRHASAQELLARVAITRGVATAPAPTACVPTALLRAPPTPPGRHLAKLMHLGGETGLREAGAAVAAKAPQLWTIEPEPPQREGP